MKKSKPCPKCGQLITAVNKTCRKCVDWHSIRKIPKPDDFKLVRTCAKCGQDFKITQSRQKFCEPCRRKPGRHVAPLLTCQFCGESFKQRSGKFTKYCSQECRYKAAIKPRDDKKRTSHKYRSWRKTVLTRDNHTCQHCGKTSKLAAHHLKSWANNPEDRYSIDNGITLCEDCHSIQHNGRKLRHRSKEPKRCINCGAIKKTHQGDYCRSCSMKLSPKAQAYYETLKHHKDGTFKREPD